MKTVKSQFPNPNSEKNHKSQILNVWRLVISVWVFVLVSGLVIVVSAQGAEFIPIPPPLVTLVPKGLGNDELWYLGGTASVPNSEVIIYLQNERGETLSFTTKASDKGEWFYSHNSFLTKGKYKSWAQLRAGKELSPPGPEVSFDILPTALRIGSYRISYEAMYLVLALLMLAALLAVSGFGIYHFRHYHLKHARLRKEIREAEEEARRGFEILRGDIKEEMEFISRIKMSRELSIEEHRREEKLLQDINFIEKHLLKEMGDIEPAIP